MKTQSALAAKAIKQKLKEAFPFIKFSVTSDNYSMGDAVRIHYEDGVKVSKVEDIVKKYQYGHFDGMTDMYENSNDRGDIPQAKYVQVERRRSAEADKVIIEILKKKIDPEFDPNKYYHNNWGSQLMWLEFQQMEFIPETEVKETVKVNGSFQVVDYSEKAIAVFGDTKAIKEELKAIGGRFNPFLNFNNSKNAGWIFPKTKRNEVEQLLNGATPKESEIIVNKEINLSESLMNKANSVKEQAEKINTSVNGNWTYRRQNMADAQARKKSNLLKVATILENLSKQWSEGTINNELKRIKSRADVELLLWGYYPTVPSVDSGDWYKKEYPDRKKKVDSLDIRDKEHFRSISDMLENLSDRPVSAEEMRRQELEEMIKKAHSFNIPGFFPTPDDLILEMLRLAKINGTIYNFLEPSAGIGSICDHMKEYALNIECCELNTSLSKILDKKGYNVITNDIYDIKDRANFYELILMNPPFEKREDLKQIRFCYDLLAEGGKLVSVISAGTLPESFLNWAKDKNYYIVDAPKDAFKKAFNSTNVQVKLIVIEK